MQNKEFIAFLIVLLVMILACDSQSTLNERICRKGGCNDECDLCEYGSMYNEFCGFDECRKGPGQSCHEYRNNCGRGLQCRCGKCHGCSTTSVEVNCHNSPCLLSQIMTNPLRYNY